MSLRQRTQSKAVLLAAEAIEGSERLGVLRIGSD